MNITLVSREQRHVVERLMQLYLYELSEYTEAELDEDGCYAYRYLPLCDDGISNVSWALACLSISP